MTAERQSTAAPFPQAEAAVIGALIINYGADFDRAAAVVSERDFTHHGARECFAVLRSLHDAGTSADIVLLKDELKRRGKLEAAGGPTGVDALMDAAVTSHHAEHYAGQVRKRADEHRFTVALQGIASRVGSEDLTTLREELARETADLGPAAGVMTAREILKANRATDCARDVATGWPRLDDTMGGGLDSQSMTVIAAASSVGKSQFAANLALQATREGKPARVLLVSMEMGPDLLEDRFLALLGRIPLAACRDLRTGRADDSVRRPYGEAHARAMNAFADMPVMLHADGPVTSDGLRSLVARHRRELDLVIIDYLQKAAGSNPRHDKRAIVEDFSWTCKALAMRYRLPIVALSQLNREGGRAGNDGQAGARPRLHHLRESGQIEQDADNVLLLWRDKDAGADEDVPLEIDIAKQRSGPLGMIRLRYMLKTGLIYDAPPETRPERL